VPRSPLGPPLRKRLGQHHLVDGALCRPLLDYLRPAGERVLEIGPGGGVLTRELLAAGAAAVRAVELDPAWAAILAAELAAERAAGRLALAVGDALEIDWRRLGQRWLGGRPHLVAGNLPYNVATAIVERMLTGAPAGAVPRAAFLVQREVADRLAARPGDDAYGGLSVLVAAYAEARVLGRVRPGSFRPPPRVESAFVGLAPHPPPLPAAEMPALLRTVALAFGQRRKTLRNALGAGWTKPGAAAALERAGIAPGARAEELGLDAFLALHRARWELAAGA
jgi:16S rRNA (adenine1518-N6/adenine1519-N6)-dimethyltransferase